MEGRACRSVDSTCSSEIRGDSLPDLVVWGTHDAIFSKPEQEELVRRIPGAKLHVLADVGHSPQWEAPEEFVEAMLRS